MAVLLVAFCMGYGFNELTHQPNSGPRVTGIGGIFFKAQNPTALRAWYEKNLGIHTGYTYRAGQCKLRMVPRSGHH
jgi:hypothetical protein